jgi:hypothetical protein
MNTAVSACENVPLRKKYRSDATSPSISDRKEAVGAADFEYVDLRPVRDEGSQRLDAVAEVEAETLFLGRVIKMLVAMEVVRSI